MNIWPGVTKGGNYHQKRRYRAKREEARPKSINMRGKEDVKQKEREREREEEEEHVRNMQNDETLSLSRRLYSSRTGMGKDGNEREANWIRKQSKSARLAIKFFS